MELHRLDQYGQIMPFRKTWPAPKLQNRGASRWSVWLSWQTPLYCRCSALKLIKYQTLSLQISNAGGLEQATAYIYLLTCIVLLQNNSVPALSKWCLCNDMKQFTFLNTLNWYCIKRTCFRISSSGSANSNASKAVRSSYTATHTQSCFVIFCFMARGHSLQFRSFCFAVLA